MNRYNVNNPIDPRIVAILQDKARLIQKAIKEIEEEANKKIKELKTIK